MNADLFRDRRSQLARIVLLLCGFYFALAFAGQAWKARALSETLAAEQARLQAQEATNAELQARLDRLNGKEYAIFAEQTARKHLGMIKPGDKAVFVVPDPDAPSVEPSAPLQPDPSAAPAPEQEQPVWRQWVSVFFP